MAKNRLFWVVLMIFVILVVYIAVEIKPKNCSSDSDCVVFGEDGDCNCGCYLEGNLPKDTGGECFCAAPRACKCVDEMCEGVF